MPNICTGDEKNGKENKKLKFVLEIHRNKNASWQGIVYWNSNGREHSFRSTLELIKQIDLALNSDDFHALDELFYKPIPFKKANKNAVFIVEILYQQNASWQGIVTWVAQSKLQSFRSALELLLLIDSAFSSTDSRGFVDKLDTHKDLVMRERFSMAELETELS